ncbi:MAG: NADH-quinone oxidoreductase subunit L [Planctomycetota bacterium]
MQTQAMSELAWIPLLPLIGFVINGIFGKQLPQKVVAFVACGAMAGSFALSLAVFAHLAFNNGDGIGVGGAATHTLYSWISVGGLNLNFGLFVDNLTGVMLLVVTGVGLLIHIYSVGYMEHDKGFARYFAYLNLFVFSMLMLVMGDNLVLLFVGWEGVGLCSYLLIGFWFHDPEKAKAGQKAFITNRIGDLGVLIALFMLVGIVGTLSIPAINQAAHHVQQVAAQGSEAVATAPAAVHDLASYAWLIALFLFVGAIGKSAQIPLYVWLPDAMAGPTPVSALIHAATMVTAGVFMVVRLGALFTLTPFTSSLISLIGGATALFAALIALTQTDIKKVLAYSTVSQLGYMFMAAGAGAVYSGAYVAAIFHLVTHAFFKALLFMGAGSVIHAMHHAYPKEGEEFHQDMRNMGGLNRKMPITWMTFLVGGIALAGIPPLAGFFSKDEILHGVMHSAGTADGIPVIFYSIAFGFGIVAAFLTAFYTTRLVVRTFRGEHRGTAEGYRKLHESPRVMYIPLAILAVLSILGGVLVNMPGAGEGAPTLETLLMHDKDSSLLANTVPSPHAGHGAHLAGDGHGEPAAAQSFADDESTAMWKQIFGELTVETLVLMLLSTLIAVGGAWYGYRLYTTGYDKHVAKFADGSVWERARRLSYGKFFVDEFYEKWILRPLWTTAAILFILVDRLLIDLTVFLMGQLVLFASGVVRRVQTGLLSFYAESFTIGALVVLVIVLWSLVF